MAKRPPADDDLDDLMAEFVETTQYEGPVQPWRVTPETDDDPDDVPARTDLGDRSKYPGGRYPNEGDADPDTRIAKVLGSKADRKKLTVDALARLTPADLDELDAALAAKASQGSTADRLGASAMRAAVAAARKRTLSYRDWLVLQLGDRSKYPGGRYPNENDAATASSAVASLPEGGFKSREAKAWKAAHQHLYDTDPEFRLAMDGAALFTHGRYKDMAAAMLRDELVEQYGDDPRNPTAKRPDWRTQELHHLATQDGGKYVLGPLNEEDLPGKTDEKSAASFDGQAERFHGEHGKGTATESIRDAALALQRAVASAPPMADPIYRGMFITPHEFHLSGIKEGEPFELKAPASFTSDEELASRFASGTAPGNAVPSYNKRGGLGVVFKAEPGAPAMKVSALSRWNQKEVLTSGKFKVTKIENDEARDGTPLKIVTITHEH